VKSTFEKKFKIGLSHIQRQDYALALRCFYQVLQIDPGHCGAWGNIGLCLRSLEKHKEAIEAYEILNHLCPKYNLIGRISIGECELALGNLDRAGMIVNDVLKEAPTMPEAWIGASNYYSKIGDYQKTRIYSEKAIELDPNRAIAHLNHGWALLNMENYSAALTATNAALELDPNCTQALINAGTIHLQMGNYEESIEMSNKALSLQANCIDALVNIAKAYKEQGNLRDAFASLNHLETENGQALLVKSEIFNELGEIDTAIQCLQKAISCHNEKARPELLYSLGTLLLKRGEFDTGFKLYEYRKKPELINQYEKKRDLSIGSTICKLHHGTLIRKEQGIGDNILFASLLPEALEQGSTVYLEVDSRLHRLYKRSFGKTLHLVGDNNSLDKATFDRVMPIGSLGTAYRSSQKSFNRQPIGYLKADQQKSHYIRRELTGKFKASKIIGISWFSAGLKRQNRKKCIDLRRLMQSLGSQQDYIFINLQYNWKNCPREDKDEITQRGNIYTPEIDLYNDLDDVASYLDACDTIITVSTSLAHLACALGKETNVLLPLSAIWHWGSEPERTAWYSTAKLYRQEELDNWEHPLMRLSYDLHKSAN